MPPKALIGRSRELSQLTRSVAEACNGHGALVLVAGEPGIGKTRLAEEVDASAKRRGAAVLWASCREDASSVAYFPWAQLLGDHFDGVDDARLRVELADAAPVVPRLLPRLRRRLAPSEDPAERAALAFADGVDPESARFQFLDGLVAVVKRMAAARPLALVLDDLHWADEASLRLLRFLRPDLPRLPVLIVGTYRDLEVDMGSERGRLLAELAGPTLIELAGLEREDVAALVAAESGTAPDPDVSAAIWQRSGGNPFFVQQLTRVLGEPGVAVPEGARALLTRRIDGLAAGCRDALDVCAVLGQDFRVDVAAEVLGSVPAELLALLGEAMAARVVQPSEPRGGAWTFSHALLRAVVYERLPLARRAALHRAVGEVLEARPDRDAHVAELAHHFVHASAEADTARAVHYSEQAGRRALDVLAYEEAAEHFARALDVLATHVPEDQRRADMLLLLGDAQLRAGDIPAARTTFAAAAGLARRRGRPQELARAALGFGAGLGGFEVKLFDEPQIDLLEGALEALGPSDSQLRAWVLARLSVALSFVAPGDRRRVLSEEAVAIARRLGDEAALAHALASHCDAIAGPRHAAERRRDAAEIVRLARGVRDRPLELLGRRLFLVAALEQGDLVAVDAEIEAFARTAEATGQPLFQWFVPLWRAMRAAMEGRMDDAERWNEEAAALGRLAHSENAAVSAAGQRFVIESERGETAAAEPKLRALFEGGLPLGYSGRAWLAAVVARAGRRAEALALVHRMVADDLAELPDEDAEWLPAMTQLAEASFLLEAEDAAAVLYDRLVPHAGLFAVDGIGNACLGAVDRFLGLLASVLGRQDEAGGHFDAALAANRRAGAPVLVAHTLRQHGESWRREGPGCELLRQAAEIYRELGLDRWVGDEDAPGNEFQRHGELWTIAFAGRTVHLKDAKGLHDLARLLARPGQEIHVRDLVGTAGPAPGVGDSGEVLDDRARAEYRSRLAELDADLADATAANDPVRAARVEEERDVLVRELTAAYGLGGRPRRAGDPVQRARSAVAWRIKDSIGRIERAHPALGRHLRNSVRTGVFCSYQPEQPLTWQL